MEHVKAKHVAGKNVAIVRKKKEPWNPNDQLCFAFVTACFMLVTCIYLA
jgi:hypothetical protein